MNLILRVFLKFFFQNSLFDLFCLVQRKRAKTVAMDSFGEQSNDGLGITVRAYVEKSRKIINNARFEPKADRRFSNAVI